MLGKLYSLARGGHAANVKGQHALISSIPHLKALLDADQEVVMVLNCDALLVFANQATVELAGAKNSDALLGCRTGDVLRCTESGKQPGGCGAGEFCQYCGNRFAIAGALDGKVGMSECCVAHRGRNDNVYLRVKTTPITVEGERFVVLSALDITDEKRRKALERTFFHDLLNTAGGIVGFADLLQEVDLKDMEELKAPFIRTSRQLVEEILAQRDLLAAERDDLRINTVTINSLELLQSLASSFKSHKRFHACQVKVAAADFMVKTDKTLLVRILGNMLKNALEASDSAQGVELRAALEDGRPVFGVWNQGYVPREVQAGLFKGSFSTKGDGRGLGTYSMKLFGEKYLDGQVACESSPAGGTVFKITLPATSLA